MHDEKKDKIENDDDLRLYGFYPRDKDEKPSPRECGVRSSSAASGTVKAQALMPAGVRAGSSSR